MRDDFLDRMSFRWPENGAWSNPKRFSKPVSYSAEGEELWIAAQFERDFVGYMVDVGAHDGLSTSNSMGLELAGWRVLCVEPNPDCEGPLRQSRQWVATVACSDHMGQEDLHINVEAPGALTALKPTLDHAIYHPGKEWKTVSVPVVTLNHLLETLEFPRLDALSIDTEGTELDVLKGLDLARWRPKCIVCESWEKDNPVVTYLGERGYRRVERRGVNDLMLRGDA